MNITLEQVYNIIKESMDDDIEYLTRSYGEKVVDRVEVDGFKLVLFKSGGVYLPEGDYQLGMAYGNNYMLRQGDDEKGEVSRSPHTALRKLQPVIREWLEMYGSIHVGSFNERKTRVYKKMFDRYTKIKTSDIKGSFFTISL